MTLLTNVLQLWRPGQYIKPHDAGPRVRQLFGSGEQGAWYDPSDFSTLFQDSAGTTPVTAVEQPVGRMLDKSGNGNHASQATTTKRGVVSRRVNLRTPSQAADGLGTNGISTATISVPGFDGFTAGFSVRETATVGPHSLSATPVVAGALMRVAYIVKDAGRSTVSIADAGTDRTVFDLSTKTISGFGVSEAKITELHDGFFLIESTRVWVYTNVYLILHSGGVFIYTGDPAKGIDVAGIDVRLAADAHLPYQWVNTATDYDDDHNKFPTYIRFDGVDDAYQTGSIDFTGTDKMTVVAGAVITSQTGSQLIAELGTVSTDTGAFSVFCRTADARPLWLIATPQFALYANPESSLTTTINSVIFDRTKTSVGQLISARQNGVPVIPYTGSSAGGVNQGFANASLNIGARNGGVLHYFNGRLYSLIVRGAATPLTQIEAVENIIKKNMRLP